MMRFMWLRIQTTTKFCPQKCEECLDWVRNYQLVKETAQRN